jgi:hypothetical protein
VLPGLGKRSLRLPAYATTLKALLCSLSQPVQGTVSKLVTGAGQAVAQLATGTVSQLATDTVPQVVGGILPLRQKPNCQHHTVASYIDVLRKYKFPMPKLDAMPGSPSNAVTLISQANEDNVSLSVRAAARPG